MRFSSAALDNSLKVLKSMPNVIPLPLANGGSLDKCVNASIEVLKRGGIIALPTDTVYGIAGFAQDSVAIKKIYSVKQRDCNKPLAISVGKVEDVYKWGKVTIPKQLLEELLPGPVTLVFERQAALNPLLNPNTDLVGIRIPKQDFIRRICLESELPLALTSANTTSHQSTLHVNEFKHLWPSLDAIFDGGHSSHHRSGSTVVDLSVIGKYKIIREGSAFNDTKELLLKFGVTNTED